MGTYQMSHTIWYESYVFYHSWVKSSREVETFNLIVDDSEGRKWTAMKFARTTVQFTPLGPTNFRTDRKWTVLETVWFERRSLKGCSDINFRTVHFRVSKSSTWAQGSTVRFWTYSVLVRAGSGFLKFSGPRTEALGPGPTGFGPWIPAYCFYLARLQIMV